MTAMTAQEESVYNLVPTQETSGIKAARYKSRHPGKVDPGEFETGVRHKQQTATFGKPDGTVADTPDQFLQSRTVPFHQTMRGTQQRSPKQKLKAELPDRTQEPEHGKWSGQDFTKTNALSIINASPPRREEPLLWTQKPDFGKVPDYLVQAQRQQSREHAEREAAEALRLQQENRASALPEQERLETLRLLKVKWAEVNTQYQKMPFALDTASKKHRKESLEAQMTSIEQDIYLLERGPVLVMQD